MYVGPNCTHHTSYIHHIIHITYQRTLTHQQCHNTTTQYQTPINTKHRTHNALRRTRMTWHQERPRVHHRHAITIDSVYATLVHTHHRINAHGQDRPDGQPYMKHHERLDARNAQEYSTTKPIPSTAFARYLFTPTTEETQGNQPYDMEIQR